MAGERRRLRLDALLHVAVARDHEGVVVDDLVLVVVEPRGNHPLAERDAGGHRDALAERSGGRLDARRVLALGVARGGGADLAEVLQVVERHRVAGEVEHRVEEHRRVARAQDEAVAPRPVGIARVVAHHPRVEHVGERGKPHRSTRVARVRLLDGVHGQRADRVMHSSSSARVSVVVVVTGPLPSWLTPQYPPS